MGKADRMTEEELEYIRAVYPKLGPSEIARRLGRSLSAVKSRIKQMGLKKSESPFAVVSVKQKGESQSTYERLLELREILKDQLVDAPSNCIASLSKEYRAVLKDIEAFEQNDQSKGQEDPLERIAKAIANGM